MQTRIEATARAVPAQRTPPDEPARVVTFHDSSGWSYRVEGEPDCGHRFADRAPAIAAGRYLARTLRAEHTIEDRDGTVCERHDFGDSCACHPPRAVAGD